MTASVLGRSDQSTVCFTLATRSFLSSSLLVTSLCAGTAALLPPIAAAAPADAPPRNYLDLGPHFVLTAGVGSTSEYRDWLLKKGLSARMGATATYRGFALSTALDRSAGGASAYATEISATYSHKIPYLDVHLGLVHSRVNAAIAEQCTSISLSGSTHSLHSTKIDFTLQRDFSRKCTARDLGLSREIWAEGFNQIDLRISTSRWASASFTATGWSARALGRRQLKPGQSLHYHMGHTSSKLERSAGHSRLDGAAIGANYVWEFR